MDAVCEKHDIEELQALLKAHLAATGSPKAKEILSGFPGNAGRFKKILPHDYDRMLRMISKFEKRGMNREQAEIEAFYQSTKGGDA